MKKPANQVRSKHSGKTGAPQARFSEIKIVRLNDHQAENPVVDNPQAVQKLWREHVIKSKSFDAERENLVVFTLNTWYRITSFQIVSQGTLDTIISRPIEILRPAIIQNASAIIMAHNHPSGDPLPSDSDISVTRNLLCACRTMNLEFVDHIIIASESYQPSYTSLKEYGCFHDDENDKLAKKDSYSLVDFESTIQKTLGLIDLFDAKLRDSVYEEMHHSSPSYDEMTTVIHIGLMNFAFDVKKELYNAFNSIHRISSKDSVKQQPDGLWRAA